MADIGRVQAGGNNSYRTPNTGGVKEKLRAEYNPSTKTFEPMTSAGETKKLDDLHNLEGKVSKVPVPTDYSSPTYLQKVKTQLTSKGSEIETDTKNVGKYFSGNSTLYDDFIDSVSTAQDSL